MANGGSILVHQAAGLLVERRIISVGYMSEAEAIRRGWSSRPLVLFLDNGETVLAQSPAGNGAGDLQVGSSHVFPALAV